MKGFVTYKSINVVTADHLVEMSLYIALCNSQKGSVFLPLPTPKPIL